MRKSLALLLVVAIGLPALALYRAGFSPDLIGKKISSITRLKDTGEAVGKGESQIGRTVSGGKDFIVMKNEGSIRIKEHTYTSRVTKYYTYENGTITIYSIEGVTDKDGQPYQNYRNSFDWPNRLLSVSFNDLEKKETKKKTLALTDRMISVQDLEIYLSTLPARGLKEGSVKAFVPDGTSFGLLLKVAGGREMIKVNGREVACIRVELKPDLGLLSAVIPNVNYWLRATPPYTLVRYVGLLSGPGSPNVIQEVLD